MPVLAPLLTVLAPHKLFGCAKKRKRRTNEVVGRQTCMGGAFGGAAIFFALFSFFCKDGGWGGGEILCFEGAVVPSDNDTRTNRAFPEIICIQELSLILNKRIRLFTIGSGRITQIHAKIGNFCYLVRTYYRFRCKQLFTNKVYRGFPEINCIQELSLILNKRMRLFTRGSGPTTQMHAKMGNFCYGAYLVEIEAQTNFSEQGLLFFSLIHYRARNYGRPPGTYPDCCLGGGGGADHGGIIHFFRGKLSFFGREITITGGRAIEQLLGTPLK